MATLLRFLPTYEHRFITPPPSSPARRSSPAKLVFITKSQSQSSQLQTPLSKNKKKRRPENVDGDFFVDHTCIDCDTCRWMAPEIFTRVGDMSAVSKQPSCQDERIKALQALLSCPTSSISTEKPAHDILEVQKTFPIPVDMDRIPGVYHCGYHSDKSYGAASYLLVHPEGNILIDSPRYTERLASNIEKLGGARYMFLTHRTRYTRCSQYKPYAAAMTKPDDGPRNVDKPAPTSLHPAYSVSNIQSKIRTLDGTKVTYSSWVKLFRFHAIAYKVLDHLDDTPPPAPADPSYGTWKEIDALVSQWIYSTLSDELASEFLDTDATARKTWVRLQQHFLSNKQAKAAALETRFVNLTLASCSSVDDYCKQLQELANQLADVDQPVSKQRLVLQLVRGLSAEFDTTAQLIHAQQADWNTAKTMLQDEVIRLESRKQTSSSVLVAGSSKTTNNPPPSAQSNHYSAQPNHYSDQPPSSGSQLYRGRGRGRGYNSRGRGRRGRGYGSQPSYTPWPFSPQQYPQWAWWSPPPCPYPTQSNWRPNSTSLPTNQPQTQNPAAHFAGYSSQQAGYSPSAPAAPPGFDALCPSDLSKAFSTMQMHYYDPNLIMDTGAEQHVTENKEKWSKRLNCERVLHSTEVNVSTSNVEIKLNGCGPWSLSDNIQLIHTPGHTEGSVCLFYKPLKVLFTGDHLAMDESNSKLAISEQYNFYSGAWV